VNPTPRIGYMPNHAFNVDIVLFDLRAQIRGGTYRRSEFN
jgi:hypothetical protein